MLAGLLTLRGNSVTKENSELIDLRQHALQVISSPWNPLNQLVPLKFSHPLMRALDRTDAPSWADSENARYTIYLGRGMLPYILNSSSDEAIAIGRDLEVMLAEPLEILEEQASASFWAQKHYNYVQHYKINFPQPVANATVAISEETWLRRAPDAAAMLLDDGTLLLNGWKLMDLSHDEETVVALRFMLGVHNGAAEARFQLSDVPGDLNDTTSLATKLLYYGGLVVVDDSAVQPIEEDRYDVYSRGTPVIIDGILTQPRLNGRTGKVQSFQAERDRYTVTLDEGHLTATGSISVSADKLQQLVPGVCVDGVASKPQLNGLKGKMNGFDKNSGCFLIQMNKGEDATVSLPPQNVILPKGVVVEVVSMQEEPQLNGRRGKIVFYDKASGCYSVQMSRKEIKLIHLENVRPG
eukprot:gnl/MRDRNA2_/MRDRNA2_304151_c0_seq1.p1 gnl/MRDRNA2_/MRDRNA2_304151_c0~~gnl/MRDRNA2_/MRDRNA2_304151_c0_seq1.p1  ORF type:complete len:443 (-),score=79.06 gnl/MRDRNA2_/MRDRNA2_304151_c0_seq1:40-1272(-)